MGSIIKEDPQKDTNHRAGNAPSDVHIPRTLSALDERTISGASGQLTGIDGAHHTGFYCDIRVVFHAGQEKVDKCVVLGVQTHMFEPQHDAFLAPSSTPREKLHKRTYPFPLAKPKWKMRRRLVAE
jgi:hypothetical protein